MTSPQPPLSPESAKLIEALRTHAEAWGATLDHGALDLLRDAEDELSDHIRELERDARRMDELNEAFERRGTLTLSNWCHDGRRLINDGTTLLVHKTSSRGGKDETLRDAIDASFGVPDGRYAPLTAAAAPTERDG